jgi:hypothetical protein
LSTLPAAMIRSPAVTMKKCARRMKSSYLAPSVAPHVESQSIVRRQPSQLAPVECSN